MALGTILAAFPGRRRNPIDPVSAPLPEARRSGAAGGGGSAAGPTLDRRADPVPEDGGGGSATATVPTTVADEAPDRVEVPT